MGKLTILNHWKGNPVDVTINNNPPVRLSPGDRLERVLAGRAQVSARATGGEAGFIRPGGTADDLAQDRVFILDAPDPNQPEFTFTVN